jgi:hypothetical protein
VFTDMLKNRNVKVGEIEIPLDYWSMKKDERTIFCLTLMDGILTLLDRQIKPEYNRIDFLSKLIDSSIETNEMEENYEVCQVLKDIRNLIDEENI